MEAIHTFEKAVGKPHTRSLQKAQVCVTLFGTTCCGNAAAAAARSAVDFTQSVSQSLLGLCAVAFIGGAVLSGLLVELN